MTEVVRGLTADHQIGGEVIRFDPGEIRSYLNERRASISVRCCFRKSTTRPLKASGMRERRHPTQHGTERSNRTVNIEMEFLRRIFNKAVKGDML